ncbi:MAG TPA: VOC family protein [Streptosporangiaceae bacterium]
MARIDSASSISALAGTGFWPGSRLSCACLIIALTVDDIDAQLSRLVSAGAQELQPVRDVGGGKLIASVKDPDGNIIGLMQNL